MPSEPSVTDILDEVARRIDERIPQGLGIDESVFAHLRLMLDEAHQHAHVGEDIPAGVRARQVRKVLLGGLRPVTTYQRAFNTRVLEVLETLTGLAHVQAVDRHPIEPQLNRMNAAVATIDVAIDEVSEQVRALDARVADIEQGTTAGEAPDTRGRRDELQRLLDRIQRIEARIDRLRREPDPTDEVRPGPHDAPSPTTAQPVLDVAEDPDRARLYTDLEDTFRGSRAEVRALLEPYVADIERLGSPAKVIDIGCGRGEWLGILRDHHIAAYGVDLNPLSVAECTEQGLDARHADAIDHLASLPGNSVAAVTGFHVAEHLPTDDLLALIDAALGALEPGGMLILETPNSTNLVVGASSFYLDPTHLRPLHPQLLEFLCRQRGFDDVEIRYLHPRRPVPDDESATTRDDPLPGGMLAELEWALFGPMDYAVLATKSGRSDPRE